MGFQIVDLHLPGVQSGSWLAGLLRTYVRYLTYLGQSHL